MDRKATGFTLIEALVVLAVLSLTVCIAEPLYSTALAKTRIMDAQVRLHETLTTSMRHAMVTSTNVVLCPSTDQQSCASGADWSGGWIAFADLNKDRQPGPHDPVIRRQERFDRSIAIAGSSSRARLVFQANGGNPGANTTFTFCDRRGVAPARSLMLANSGRLRQSTADPDRSSACRGSHAGQ